MQHIIETMAAQGLANWQAPVQMRLHNFKAILLRKALSYVDGLEEQSHSFAKFRATIKSQALKASGVKLLSDCFMWLWKGLATAHSPIKSLELEMTYVNRIQDQSFKQVT